MRTKFAENFDALLKAKNISQSQFAKLYGVRANTVNQWANGKREPTYHDLLSICVLLDVDIKEILGFTARTKEAILRDIIAGSDEFQTKQNEIYKKLFNEGKTDKEIAQACQELYEERYNFYAKIFKW